MALVAGIAETPPQCDEWDSFVTAHPSGTHWHLSWWLQHHRRWFRRASVVMVRRDGRIVAGTAVHHLGPSVRGCSVAVVTNGPLVHPGDEVALDALLDALVRDAERSGSMLLQFEAFDAGLYERLRHYFSGWETALEPIWNLYHPGVWREIRIPLAGMTPDELFRKFNRTCRKQIRRAEEVGVEVSEGCDDATVRRAYDAWVASAARQGYAPRPYEDFLGLTRTAADHGMAKFLVASVGGRTAAFLFSIFYRVGAAALYTGYTEEHAEIPCSRLLHWRTMVDAIGQGIPYLTLMAPGRGGGLKFKQDFHAALVNNSRFMTVVLRPRMVRLAAPFITSPRWAAGLKWLLLSRRGQAQGDAGSTENASSSTA